MGNPKNTRWALSKNSQTAKEKIESLSKDIGFDASKLKVGDHITSDMVPFLPEDVMGGKLDAGTIDFMQRSVVKSNSARPSANNTGVTNQNSSKKANQEYWVPIGQYSSARMPGQMGVIKAGEEMNALDVISEQNYINNGFKAADGSDPAVPNVSNGDTDGNSALENYSDPITRITVTPGEKTGNTTSTTTTKLTQDQKDAIGGYGEYKTEPTKNKQVYKDVGGDASIAEEVYQKNKKAEEYYHTHFFKNNLLDYDSPTYNFELVMLTEEDAKSAQQYIRDGNFEQQSFSNWKPKNDTVTIAQTASTVLNINAVEIKATAGPIDNGKRLTGAVDFVLNLAQPLNASFTDIIVNSAVELGIPDGFKACFMLKLKFIGRDSYYGTIVNPIPDSERQFLIEIVAVEATVDSNGAQYIVQAARAGDKGIRSDHYQTDRPIQLNNLKTVNDLIDNVQEVLNLNELDKLAIEKGVLDEYYIHLDKDAKEFIGNADILDTDSLTRPTTNQNDSEKSGANPHLDYDPNLKMFRIPQGTTIDRILEFGLSHCKKLQKMAKGLDEAADADSTDSADVTRYVKHIYHIKVDTVNIVWDMLRNDYAREFHYTISMFPTIRPEVSPGTWKNSPEVAEEKIAALLKGNLNEKSEGRGYKAMTKRYDYLFTGLNDKVLRFDIKYNNHFFFALHSYRSIFAGLDETTKAKISKSASSLIKYKEAQAELRNKWQSYLKKKSETFTSEEANADAEFGEFLSTRQKLIDAYVEGVDDGTFEGDSSIAKDLQKVGEEDQLSRKRLSKEQNEKEYASNDSNQGDITKRMWGELLSRNKIRQDIDKMEKPFQIMWGSAPDSFRNKFNADDETPGKGGFDSVLEATLSDYSADMVHMDMDIRGDLYWLEGEREPGFRTASYYDGENYLLFRAITSAGEPNPYTGITTPGDAESEQMLNGVYAVVEVTSRFESGQFVQNIKGVKEAFISDISKLTSFAER
jgi:hypothetical protein